MIEPGETAPDFTLPDQDGVDVTLSQLRGGPVVLYFYPKADTPGCTTQACGGRDHLQDYDAAGATVLGVSPDPVKAVKKFHDKQALTFTLLADRTTPCARPTASGRKSMYGRTYWGALRATFVIDAEGVVRHRIPKGRPRRTTTGPEGPRRDVGSGRLSTLLVVGAGCLAVYALALLALLAAGRGTDRGRSPARSRTSSY